MFDVLAVPGCGEPGQKRTHALKHPPVRVNGAEQLGEGTVIGELTLKFLE